MANKTINIAPDWKTSAEIIILVLQNKNLDNRGYQNVFEMVREMGSNLDFANHKIKKLQEKINFYQNYVKDQNKW